MELLDRWPAAAGGNDRRCMHLCAHRASPGDHAMPICSNPGYGPQPNSRGQCPIFVSGAACHACQPGPPSRQLTRRRLLDWMSTALLAVHNSQPNAQPMLGLQDGKLLLVRWDCGSALIGCRQSTVSDWQFAQHASKLPQSLTSLLATPVCAAQHARMGFL